MLECTKTKLVSYCNEIIRYSLYSFAFSLCFFWSAMQIFYFIALFAFLIKIILDWELKNIKKELNLFDIAFIVLFFVSYVSVLTGINTLNSLNAVFKTNGWMLLYLIMVSSIKDKEQVKKIVFLIIISGVIGGIYAIIRGPDNANRLYGGAGHPLSLSEILLFIIPITLAFVVSKSSLKVKILLIISLIFVTTIEILTYVKAGLISLFSSIIIVGAVMRRKQIFIILLILAMLVALIVLFLPDSFFSHVITKRFDPKFMSNHERLCMWKSGISIFKDFPFGIGIGNLSQIYPKYKLKDAIEPNHGHLHNNFLQISVERGGQGLVTFLFLIFSFYYVSLKSLSNIKDTFNKITVIGIIGGVSAFFISGIFEYDFGASMVVLNFWFFTGLCMAIIRLKPKSIGVFLDRDGTIDVEKGYLSTTEELELLPHAAEAIKILNDKNFPVIVTTNQSGVSRKKFTEKTLKEINKKLEQSLKEKADAVLNEIWYCIHLPETGCECRKPNSGMLFRAANKYNIDLKNSYVVGDKVTDIEFGNKAGAKSILVLTGDGRTEKDKLGNIKPVYIAENLMDAVNWLVLDSKAGEKC